jgi:hypothetical protein
MTGNFNLPIAKGNAKTYVFTTENTTAASTPWRGMTVWNKPPGINFVYGLLIGGGSGGAGGFSFGAGTAGGGGGGGTPGGVIQFIQPAYLVPDKLTVTVARGGRGGAAGNNGGYPSTTTGLWYQEVGQTSLNINRVYYAFPNSSLTGTQTGRVGSAVAAGLGGAAATLSTTANQPGIMGFCNFAQPATLGGQNGGLAAGGNNAPFVGRPQGGAGGGGVSSGVTFNGGNVFAPTTSVNSIWSRNLLGGASAGANGEDGITLFEPTFFSLPGAGGAGNASGVGGNGGKGGIGCGGGGGGAGTTGGPGGEGGDGLVMLVCW